MIARRRRWLMRDSFPSFQAGVTKTMSSSPIVTSATAAAGHGGGGRHSSPMQLDVPRGTGGRPRGPCAKSAFEPSTQQQPGAATNVGELVAKAKKAAVSLWMILHAQNCRLPEGTCPHRACPETKLLLEHVKNCPAGPDFPCPTRCKGCSETRKLLAHYRKCKDMRMKQVGSGRRSGLRPEQGCLVCSLMARHAKSVLDRNGAKQSSPSPSGRTDVVSLLSTTAEGNKFSIERGMTSLERTPSMTLMPPPPPRPIPVPSSSAIIKRISSSESFGSPPNPSQLVRCSDIATVVAAAMTDPDYGPSVAAAAGSTELETSGTLVGKSVDSSFAVVPFPILRNNAAPVKDYADGAERMVEDEGPAVSAPGLAFLASAATGGGAPSPRSRRRAESYDERRTRVRFAPNVVMPGNLRYRFDRVDDWRGEGQHVEEGGSSSSSSRTTARPRSASCGNDADDGRAMMPASPGCETIAEEAAAEHEEPVFHMD